MCNSAGRVPRLSIRADVRKDMDSLDVFSLHPYQVDLDKSRPEDQSRSWEYEFTLKNVSEEELTFTVISRPEQYAEVDFPEESVVKPGKERTFKVKFEKDIADDVFTKSFTIQASDEKQTRLTIPFVKAMRWGPAPMSQH